MAESRLSHTARCLFSDFHNPVAFLASFAVDFLLVFNIYNYTGVGMSLYKYDDISLVMIK